MEEAVSVNEPQTHYILPAEYVGDAQVHDGLLDVGGLKIPVAPWVHKDGNINVFVRRDSKDLSVFNILMSRGDGFAQEELDHQNEEAERYALGPKEYWRSKMVGKYLYGPDSHVMTDEEFEADWTEGYDGDSEP